MEKPNKPIWAPDVRAGDLIWWDHMPGEIKSAGASKAFCNLAELDYRRSIALYELSRLSPLEQFLWRVRERFHA